MLRTRRVASPSALRRYASRIPSACFRQMAPETVRMVVAARNFAAYITCQTPGAVGDGRELPVRYVGCRVLHEMTRPETTVAFLSELAAGGGALLVRNALEG